jgi:2-polyprenyl-6-methoxyphenol hydroxylase-like FAD-dependent oxidoreductase
VTYDIITVGGGLGGSALAIAMSRLGKRVVVLENDLEFRDRVRGEQVTSWGTAEAKELGLFDLLVSDCATIEAWWDIFIGGQQIMHRNMEETTVPQTPNLTFYHPRMQETLLKAAEASGAEVRRGARVKQVEPGEPPAVLYELDGSQERVEARLVVGADGRNSLARSATGLDVQRDPERLQLSGIFVENCALPSDTAHMNMNPILGLGSLVLPQDDGKARLYLATRVDARRAYSGPKDVQPFLEDSERSCLDPGLLKPLKFSGPLATFSGACVWVDHPYSNGIALVGDAAGHSDPCWGQGLSLTMRDVRVLRDRLAETDDWDAAGNNYANKRNAYYQMVRTLEDWNTTFFFDVGREADERRERAFALIEEDPSRMPDNDQSGPETAPLDEATRKRFFGEE